MLPGLEGVTRPQLTGNKCARQVDCVLDCWLIPPKIIDFGFSFSLFYATQKGLGLHARDVLPENENALNKANYAFTVLYVSITPS